MKPYIFHITLFDLALLVAIVIGINFFLLLWFSKRTYHSASKYLALALVVSVLWTARILAIDIRLAAIFPIWACIPLRFSLALGPLIYFYVLKITRPEFKPYLRDLLHFSPLLLELSAQLGFQQLNPVLSVLAFISVIIYLYFSHRLIERFYQGLKFNEMSDRYRYQLHWLHRLLTVLGLLWLLWIPFTAAHYYFQSGIIAYYPLYLLLMGAIIWIAVVAHLRPDAGMKAESLVSRSLPTDLKQKRIWLKRVVKENRYYQDPELSLTSLADELGLTTHELSRMINTALKKSFNDFINEYRVAEVAQKMQDPTYDHLTLMGIAYDSGFNSQSTFHRAFKELTGKTPAEYKKELPFYNLTYQSRFAAVISNHETTHKWSEEKLNRNYMFRNYLKIAWRNITHNRSYTIINVTGLAVGITCCILIMLFVRSELSYDAFHSKADRLYRVWERVKIENKNSEVVRVSLPLADALQSNFPQVETACRVHSFKPTVKVGQRFFAEDVDMVDPSFFKMFDFKIIKGDAGNPFSADNSIVITPAAAKKYFGTSEAIGKTIVINFGAEKLLQDNTSSGVGGEIFTVSGIINEAPEASSIKYGALISFANAKGLFSPGLLRSWLPRNSETYVLLKPNVTAPAMEKRFPAMLKEYLGPDFKPQDFSLHLQAIKDIHLDTSLPAGNEPISDPKYSYILGTIGLLILLIACINFITLSIGQSTKRAMEVGVRKAMGAARAQLIFQFWGEAFVVVLISVLMGLLFACLLIGPFDTLVNRQISIHFDWFFILFCMLMVIVIALISGIYPALILSGFNPVEVLKGKLNLKGGSRWLRQILVVGQFVTSIIMIIGTVIIGQQMHYLQTKNLGYKKDQVVIVETNKMLANGYSLAELYRNELTKHPQVINSTISLFSFVQTPWAELGFSDDNKQLKLFQYNAIDANFIPTMGIKLIDGRNFEAGNSHDLGGSAIVNEAYIKAFNLTDPIGKKLAVGFSQRIIGVVKDFNFESLHTKIQPLVMSISPDSLMFISGHMGFFPALLPRVSVRLRAGNLSDNIGILKQAWASVAPGQDFNCSFLDDALTAQYKQEQRTDIIVQIASGLSIFIACMGLFGLTTLAVVKRVKEIGIRKVLGASPASIVSMLSKDFLILIIISLVIASPIAYYFMHRWLQDFAYRVTISPWTFLLSGLTPIVIALATVSFQAIKGAATNPVKSLRSE